MTVEKIGSIIHTERIHKGLSCRELAEISDTSAATVCRLETGKRKGSTKAALKIFKALGIELEIVDPNSLYSKMAIRKTCIAGDAGLNYETRKIDNSHNEARTGKEIIFMEDSFETKEETIACLHELLEWIGPIKGQIEKTVARDFTIGETLAIANVVNALQDLEDSLSELDRIVQV